MENKTSENPIVAVLYHNDADGFGAAFALKCGLKDPAVFIPVQYGQPVPEIPDTVTFLYIVDFSYDRATTEALAARYGVDRFVVLDHHQTAEKELAGLPYAVYDQNSSGCVLAWREMFSFIDVPPILQYVQDRDLWRFELPHSKQVNAYIATLPPDFHAWQKFDLDRAITCGQAIICFQNRQIERALKNARLRIVDGYQVPVVNLSDNMSEAGNALCLLFPESPFSVSYLDRADGVRTYSLRSVGNFDVSAVARKFGGGGHRNSAGFSVQLPDDQFFSAVAA